MVPAHLELSPPSALRLLPPLGSRPGTVLGALRPGLALRNDVVLLEDFLVESSEGLFSNLLAVKIRRSC